MTRGIEQGQRFEEREVEPNPYGRPPIVLVTDFGDGVAQTECLLAIHKNFSEQRVSRVDIFSVSDVTPFNKVHGAFVVGQLAKNAPDGAIIIGVVDPGVGTKNDGKREGIVVETSKHIFIGPNNGIFTRAIQDEGLQAVYEIDESHFPHATTFHGRDIFSPAAAKISSGIPVTAFATEIDASRLVELQFQPGQVVHIDFYGNIKVFAEIPDTVDTLILAGESPATIPVVESFGDVELGDPLAYKGSWGILEIALRQNNAAEHFGISVGDCLEIYFEEKSKPMTHDMFLYENSTL